MVLDTPTVSAGDTELVSIDHLNRAGGEDLVTTQATRKKGRNWTLLFQLISCGVSFFVAGVNDGSLGALLPYIIRSYGLTLAMASSLSVLLSLIYTSRLLTRLQICRQFLGMARGCLCKHTPEPVF